MSGFIQFISNLCFDACCSSLYQPAVLMVSKHIPLQNVRYKICRILVCRKDTDEGKSVPRIWQVPTRKTEQLDTCAWFVQSCRYSKSWISHDKRNDLSKRVDLYINCRINTYRMCVLLVCLYNNIRVLGLTFCRLAKDLQTFREVVVSAYPDYTLLDREGLKLRILK